MSLTDMRALRTILSKARHNARRLSGDRKGVAGIEFAVITPVLLMLLCGGAEMALYIRSNLQTSQMASTVADAVSRYEAITSTDIAGIFSVSAEIMGSSDFAQNGYVILSSVSRTSGGNPTVAWQCKAGSSVNASRVGAVSKAATLPGGLTIDATDNVIVAEVFYKHTPLLDQFIDMERQLYKTAVFRPRLGSLTTVPGC